MLSIDIVILRCGLSRNFQCILEKYIKMVLKFICL